MAYKSQMAQARAKTRSTEASARRVLKYKMDKYNSLSNKPRSKPDDYSYECGKSTHDIIQELSDTINSTVNHHKRTSFVDRMMADITSPEVKQYWSDRIAKGGIKF